MGTSIANEQTRLLWWTIWQTFFNSHKKDETNKPEYSSQQPMASTVSILPGGHVSMQGQLIEQISRLHELLEQGVLSKEQHEKLQGKYWVRVLKFTEQITLHVRCNLLHLLKATAAHYTRSWSLRLMSFLDLKKRTWGSYSVVTVAALLVYRMFMPKWSW